MFSLAWGQKVCIHFPGHIMKMVVAELFNRNIKKSSRWPLSQLLWNFVLAYMYRRALGPIMITSKSDHCMIFSYFIAMPILGTLCYITWNCTNVCLFTKHVLNSEKIYENTIRTIIIRTKNKCTWTRSRSAKGKHVVCKNTYTTTSFFEKDNTCKWETMVFVAVVLLVPRWFSRSITTLHTSSLNHTTTATNNQPTHSHCSRFVVSTLPTSALASTITSIVSNFCQTGMKVLFFTLRSMSLVSACWCKWYIYGI